MPHLHTLSLRGETSMIPDLLTQIAYAKILVKLPRGAYACLREPVNTNVSASAESTWVPHTRRFLHFKKKNVAQVILYIYIYDYIWIYIYTYIPEKLTNGGPWKKVGLRLKIWPFLVSMFWFLGCKYVYVEQLNWFMVTSGTTVGKTQRTQQKYLVRDFVESKTISTTFAPYIPIHPYISWIWGMCFFLKQVISRVG